MVSCNVLYMYVYLCTYVLFHASTLGVQTQVDQHVHVHVHTLILFVVAWVF